MAFESNGSEMSKSQFEEKLAQAKAAYASKNAREVSRIQMEFQGIITPDPDSIEGSKKTAAFDSALMTYLDSDNASSDSLFEVFQQSKQ